MAIGAALGAASKGEGKGAEEAITFFAVFMLGYISLMLFHLDRQRPQSREGIKK